MSPLPRQLQRQAADVERIQREIAEAQAAPPSAPSPTPETPVAPEPPVTPVTPPQPTPIPVEDWEQRYRSLEGKYRAEVPRLHSQLRDMQASIDALQQKLNQPPPAPPTAPAAPPAKSRLVTDKDAETFGPDLLDLIRRQAQDIADDLVSARELALTNEIKKVAAENESLKTRLGDVSKSQEATAQETYLAKLAQLIPDWEAVNVDPGFLGWLGEVDLLTGMPRQAYLDSAFQALDVNRTAALFNAWKATKAPAVPPTPTPVVPAPAVTEVQRQVTPGKTKTSLPPAADPSQKIWLVSDIEQFYTKVRKGEIVGPDVQRIEQEINLAVSTGRVR